jgi:hypothetical protein
VERLVRFLEVFPSGQAEMSLGVDRRDHRPGEER